MGIRARCDEELQVQTGLWLIVAEKRAEGWKKLLGISRTPDDNRANKFPLAIEYFFFSSFLSFSKGALKYKSNTCNFRVNEISKLYQGG